MLRSPHKFTGYLQNGILSTELEVTFDSNLTGLLRSVMNPNDHVYMLFSAPAINDTESVRVELVDNRFRLTRGLDLTTPRNFPRGACVETTMSPSHINELICIKLSEV